MMHSPFRHLLVACSALGLVLVAYTFWYGAVGSVSAHAAALANEIAMKSENTTRIAAAKTTLASLAVDEQAVHGYFVSAGDIVPFLEHLESTGRALGAKIEVVSVGAEPATPREHLRLSLKLSGSFDAVLRSLGAIEYAPYDVTLTTLTLDTIPPAGGGRAVWNAAAVFSVGTRTASSTPNASP